MALSIERKLDIMHRILRKSLAQERFAQLTEDAPRRIGRLVQEFGITKEEAKDFIQPLVASIIYDLAEMWGLLDKLDDAFRVEQDLKKKFANK